MSVAVLSAFMEGSRSTLAARLVGVVLSDSAWDDGITWVRQDTLARRAGVDERTVRRAIDTLQELGELEVRKVQKGRVRQNVYRLRLGASVPQYERLPFDLDDPFSDDRTDCPPADDRTSATRRPDKSVDDDRTNPSESPTTPLVERKENVSELATAKTAAAEQRLEAAEYGDDAAGALAEVLDKLTTAGIPVPGRHRAMIGRQAKDLLGSGFAREDVVLAALVALRRGEPGRLDYIAADMVTARAGQRLTRREYERALQDEVELAATGGGSHA